MADTGCLFQQMPPGDFAQRLRAMDGRDDIFPMSASMDWTDRCNLRCRHCFHRDRGAAAFEMPRRDAVRTLDTLRDLGTLFLVITGGEPLMRADFVSLYRHARRCGFVLNLFSNGTLWDDRRIGVVADAPPRRIEMTIYGHTEATYEAVTGVPGSFRRFRAGVDGLLRRGLLVRLKSMVLKTNMHELEAIREWAVGLGCDFRYDAVVHPCWDGDAQPLRERLPAAEVIALRRRARERGHETGSGPSPVFPPLPPRSQLFECGAGIMTMHVDAHNRAHPCMSWREDPFDLARRPSARAWNEHVREIRNRPPPGGPCDVCPDRARCSCCPALARLETGDPGGAPPFYCQLVQGDTRLP